MDFVCADVLCSHSFSPLSSDPFSFLSLSLPNNNNTNNTKASIRPRPSVR